MKSKSIVAGLCIVMTFTFTGCGVSEAKQVQRDNFGIVSESSEYKKEILDTAENFYEENGTLIKLNTAILTVYLDAALEQKSKGTIEYTMANGMFLSPNNATEKFIKKNKDNINILYKKIRETAEEGEKAVTLIPDNEEGRKIANEINDMLDITLENISMSKMTSELSIKEIGADEYFSKIETNREAIAEIYESIVSECK